MSSGKLYIGGVGWEFYIDKEKKNRKISISKHFPIMYKSRDFLDYIKTVIFGL